MRILTVRQPWAWAIIHGGKDVENRVRNIAGTYRGLVAIHGGLTLDVDAFANVNLHEAWSKLRDEDALAGGWSDRYMGAIIGVVDLADVHRVTESGGRAHCETVAAPTNPAVSGACSSWADQGAHHLVLSNPRALDEPIPYRGALGLRTLDDDTTVRILAQIGETDA